jgi:AcrR family transcriptional regulator
MPIGFSEEEKSKIRENLIKEGKKLFSIYGLKKTTINELTKAVGIAQGSFYNFFNSKEELYFDILDYEGQKLRNQLTRYNKLIDKNPKKGVKKALLAAYISLENNNLFKELFTDDTYNILKRKLSDEKINKHIELDFSEIRPLIKNWQDQGLLKEKDSEAIMGLLYSMFFITLHKEDIGESVFNKTFELLIDLIVDGLIRQGD